MLFPTDPMRPRRVDDHFVAESVAARDLGHDVGLVDLDVLHGGDVVRSLAGVRAAGRDVVYRGWMLASSGYRLLSDALAVRGVVLRTTPDQYRRGHEFPGRYADFEQLTPESHWTVGDDRAEFDRACRLLDHGPAVVRDWVKSAKHAWATAAFIPDVADREQAWSVASRLREIRDDEFTGGFVVRRFEDFVGPEARTWWVHGRCVAVTAHPDTPAEAAVGLDAAWLELVVAAAVRATALPFVTVDLVREGGGRWRVVELGDGQVSDRPVTSDAGRFIATIGSTG